MQVTLVTNGVLLKIRVEFLFRLFPDRRIRPGVLDDIDECPICRRELAGHDAESKENGNTPLLNKLTTLAEMAYLVVLEKTQSR